MSTYGIFFMGTPHLGLDIGSFELALLRIFSIHSRVGENLQREIHHASQALQTQLQLYTPLSVHFKMVFLYETYPTILVGGQKELVRVLLIARVGLTVLDLGGA